MSTFWDPNKPVAKSLKPVSEEDAARTWLSMATMFPGMLPSMQPAVVTSKPRPSLNRRESRTRKP